MKAKIVFSALFLIFYSYSIDSFGQTSDILNNQIKFSPLRIVDPINPGTELSYERRITKVFSAQLSVASYVLKSNKREFVIPET